jgi:hypothetical protein
MTGINFVIPSSANKGGYLMGINDDKVLSDAGFRSTKRFSTYHDFEKQDGPKVERITRCELGYKVSYYATILEETCGTLHPVVTSDDNLTVIQAMNWLIRLRTF